MTERNNRQPATTEVKDNRESDAAKAAAAAKAAGADIAAGADLAAAEANESIAAPMDPMVQLQADVQAAKAEAAEWQDRFLRKAAEFENYRKRADKEKTESIAIAKSSAFIEFLPIADACERALKMFADTRNAPGNLKQYQDGVELLYRQVIDTLSRVGVVAVESEGKPFDPHLHEALSREETADIKEGMVIRELRRGYTFKEKLLRPAQVIVSVYPQEKAPVS